MRKTNALSRLVLDSRAAEQLKYALMVLGLDTPAIIRDFEYRKAELGAPANDDFTRNSELEIFDRIIDQVGEDLFERQAVADDRRQRADADFGVRFGGLMRQGSDDALDQFPGVDAHRLELSPSLAGEIEDRRDQPVHLSDRGFDEAERFGKIRRELLVLVLELGLGVGSRLRHRFGDDPRQSRDAPEDVA